MSERSDEGQRTNHATHIRTDIAHASNFAWQHMNALDYAGAARHFLAAARLAQAAADSEEVPDV